MSYIPRPGTVAYRALAHLETIRTQERTATQIAEALGGGINGSEVAASLAPAVSAGAVFRRQRDKTSPRAPQWYSLTDLERHTREFRPNPAGWLERPAVFKAQGGSETPRMADAVSGAGDGDSPIRPTQPAVTNLPGHPLADARSRAMRAAIEAIPIADGAKPRNADGTPVDPTRWTNRKDAEESGSSPGTPGTAGTPAASCTSSAAQAATDAPSGEGPAAADAPRARAVESTDAKFALFCDGELMVSCGGTVIQLKAEHVQRLRRLLGGGA